MCRLWVLMDLLCCRVVNVFFHWERFLFHVGRAETWCRCHHQYCCTANVRVGHSAMHFLFTFAYLQSPVIHAPVLHSKVDGSWWSTSRGGDVHHFRWMCNRCFFSNFSIFHEGQVFPMFGSWHSFHCFRLFMRESHWTHSTSSSADCVLMAGSLFESCGCGRCFVCMALVCDFEQAFGDDEFDLMQCFVLTSMNEVLVRLSHPFAILEWLFRLLWKVGSVWRHVFVCMCQSFHCGMFGGSTHMFHICVWHKDCRFVQRFPLFMGRIGFSASVWHVFVHSCMCDDICLPKGFNSGTRAMKTQFHTQPIWFGDVEHAFHMRCLSVHFFVFPSNVDRESPISVFFRDEHSFLYHSLTVTIICFGMGVWCGT